MKDQGENIAQQNNLCSSHFRIIEIVLNLKKLQSFCGELFCFVRQESVVNPLVAHSSEESAIIQGGEGKHI